MRPSINGWLMSSMGNIPILAFGPRRGSSFAFVFLELWLTYLAGP